MINQFLGEDLKKIKLIVIDADDTLLNSKKEMSSENKAAIIDAEKQGIRVVIASGRPYAKAIIDIYKELNKYNENNYFIAYNGASIYDIKTGKSLFEDALDKNDILFLEKYFKNLNLSSARYVHLDENVTVINPNDYSYLEYKYNYKDYVVDDFKKNKIIKAYKYQIADEPEIIENLFNSLPKEIFEKYSVTITMPCFLEFMKKDVNKFTAIKKLAKKINISDDEIMAIGDSMNDYQMIEKSHIGVAMENAIDKVKKVSNFITKSNENSGVAFAINFLLKFKQKN